MDGVRRNLYVIIKKCLHNMIFIFNSIVFCLFYRVLKKTNKRLYIYFYI